MSDQVAKIIEVSERQAAALERIAAALELANYQRAFPPTNVTITPNPGVPFPGYPTNPWYVGDPPPSQSPTITYGSAGPPQTFGGVVGEDGTITLTYIGNQTVATGGSNG